MSLPSLVNVGVQPSPSNHTTTPEMLQLILEVLNIQNEETMMSIRGLSRMLLLCQVDKFIANHFRCNDKIFWRSLLAVVESRTRRVEPLDLHLWPLKGVLVIDNEILASQANDYVAANMYKRQFIKFVVYRSIHFDRAIEPRPGKRMFEELNDVFFNFVWIEDAVIRVMTRKNGSIKNVITLIRKTMNSVRTDRDSSYPQVSSEVFVAAVQVIADSTLEREKKEFTTQRLSELIQTIESVDFY